MFQQSRSNDTIQLTSSTLVISYFHSTVPKMKKQSNQQALIVYLLNAESKRSTLLHTDNMANTYDLLLCQKDEVTSARKHYSYKVQVHWDLNSLYTLLCHSPPFPSPIITIKSIPVSRLCIQEGLSVLLFSLGILSQSFFCWDKHHDQKQLGQERFYFILQLIVYHEGKPGQGLQTETWERELKQKPWRNPTYWLARFAFLPTLNRLPGRGTTHTGLGPSPSVINQENALQSSLQAETFSKLRPCLPKLILPVSNQ